MRFFSDCKNVDEAKVIYHRLAKLFHPDHGGDKEMMSMLSVQYDDFKKHGVQAEPTRFKQPTSQFTSTKSRFEMNTSQEIALQWQIKQHEVTINNLRHAQNELQNTINYYKHKEQQWEYSMNRAHRDHLELSMGLQKEINQLKKQLYAQPKTLWEFLKWKWSEQ